MDNVEYLFLPPYTVHSVFLDKPPTFFLIACHKQKTLVSVANSRSGCGRGSGDNMGQDVPVTFSFGTATPIIILGLVANFEMPSFIF